MLPVKSPVARAHRSLYTGPYSTPCKFDARRFDCSLPRSLSTNAQVRSLYKGPLFSPLMRKKELIPLNHVASLHELAPLAPRRLARGLPLLSLSLANEPPQIRLLSPSAGARGCAAASLLKTWHPSVTDTLQGSSIQGAETVPWFIPCSSQYLPRAAGPTSQLSELLRRTHAGAKLELNVQ